MLARTIRYIVISHNILMQLEYATMFFETMMHLRFERFVWIFRMINFPWARSNSKQCSCFDVAFFLQYEYAQLPVCYCLFGVANCCNGVSVDCFIFGWLTLVFYL